MSIVVPGIGWVFCACEVVEETEYGVLGPFSEGSILRRVRVFWSVAAATIIQFTVTLGASGEASANALRAGLSLIQRANAPSTPPYSARQKLGAAANGWFEIPSGIRISAGAKYLVCRLVSTTADVCSSWVVTADVFDVIGASEKVAD